ncbi:MAG: WG repeat-containing protein, partial [Firmicutes bacterium]|nr:WG repeat-containing protein [Bacillota bacterium]
MTRPPGAYKPDNSGLYPINVNGKFGFMDRSGKTVITPQFDGVTRFSEGLAAVRVGSKWGYINTKGTVVITPQFDAAAHFRYGRAIVQLSRRYGYIDKEGKYVTPPTFLWASDFSGGFAAVQMADGAWALVNKSGKTMLLAGVDKLGGEFNSGLLPAAANG